VFDYGLDARLHKGCRAMRKIVPMLSAVSDSDVLYSGLFGILAFSIA
jgi:hypothetical protein